MPISECRLHLKSLEDISDEDIKEWWQYLHTINKGDYIMMPLTDTNIQSFKRSLLAMIEEDELTHTLADFLRSKGYMLPYNGHDLFTPLPDGTVVAIRKTK